MTVEKAWIADDGTVVTEEQYERALIPFPLWYEIRQKEQARKAADAETERA